MQTKIHCYTSNEPMLKVNAFIVEAANELVIIDTTLTMSDSKALKQKALEIKKPIAGIILTHGHPDHVAGTYNLAPENNIPVYALPSVKKLMKDTEEAKHKQWSALFGAEWIPKWIYPNELVNGGDTVKIGSTSFTVIDIGAGGDCDANSIWLMEDENKAAFIGDLVYNNNHTYMNDGSILRWLANLEALSPVLKSYKTLFPGHGAPSGFSAIAAQREYFLTYCSNILKTTKGSGVFNDDTRKTFEQLMFAAYPGYGCQFMVALSADKVGKELLSLS